MTTPKVQKRRMGKFDPNKIGFSLSNSDETLREIEQMRRDRQAECNHSFSHRNDGKISQCWKCGLVRDNEP